MTATMIDLDDEALEKAKQYYGTTTKKETVNRALQDAAARLDERRTALADFLNESIDEYEHLSNEGKAEFRARMVPPERSFDAQISAYHGQPGSGAAA